MAAADVNRFCAPTLLALKQAGLEYLLFDEAQARAIRGNMQDATGQSASPDVRVPAAQAPAPLRKPQQPPRETRATSDVQAPRVPRPEAHAPERAPDAALWPAGWQERLAKTRSAPVVWTYWELGRDLCDAPDPQRRELLQALLNDLAHPPGTHSFWPMALPGRDGNGELEANAPAFWGGVRLLRSRAVMVMGPQVLRSLDLPDGMLALRPFRQVRHQGCLLVVLPPPDVLIREKQRMQALREFLRQTLAPFV
ncbi:MAG: hypothetical protein LBI88_02080 [Deltaproteobacteria bacterium]|nr:hypothetical protein [Deltaproteobacteria bacterium]